MTFFRVGVDQAPANPSRWAVRDIHMAHLAVSDPQGGRYRFDERLARSGPGLAGAAADRYEVWNDDWRAGLNAQGQHTLAAASAKAAVELTLDPGKPAVVNGVDGISQKGARPGNASHYYSLTRMPTRGTLVVDGERYEVTGESWMDHEFGTSFLEAEQQGWDWLSIQLDEGRELMLYQLRRSDGTRDPRSSGTLVDARGPHHAPGRRGLHAHRRPHLSRAVRGNLPGGLARVASRRSRSSSTSRPRSRTRSWRRWPPASPTGRG